ncbi:hypothetical protein B0H66DRAFT_251778 [Apodospora peruviana]|uniref:Uncharacterized protein n=1 Tax=Apodospora peruviana TaxID=516989 RepID=A0AAE0I5G4_9PEZI|nr:hypothetical protein B0H66DRAFT_251778 [Apodospora peruviana]
MSTRSSSFTSPAPKHKGTAEQPRATDLRPPKVKEQRSSVLWASPAYPLLAGPSSVPLSFTSIFIKSAPRICRCDRTALPQTSSSEGYSDYPLCLLNFLVDDMRHKTALLPKRCAKSGPNHLSVGAAAGSVQNSIQVPWESEQLSELSTPKERGQGSQLCCDGLISSLQLCFARSTGHIWRRFIPLVWRRFKQTPFHPEFQTWLTTIIGRRVLTPNSALLQKPLLDFLGDFYCWPQRRFCFALRHPDLVGHQQPLQKAGPQNIDPGW